VLLLLLLLLLFVSQQKMATDLITKAQNEIASVIERFGAYEEERIKKLEENGCFSLRDPGCMYCIQLGRAKYVSAVRRDWYLGLKHFIKKDATPDELVDHHLAYWEVTKKFGFPDIPRDVMMRHVVEKHEHSYSSPRSIKFVDRPTREQLLQLKTEQICWSSIPHVHKRNFIREGDSEYLPLGEHTSSCPCVTGETRESDVPELEICN
jgi:hypothetical protein